MPLKYWTREAAAALHRQVPRNLDWYRSGEGVPPIPPGTKPEREAAINIQPFGADLQLGDGPKHDRVNAQIVYNALANLTPHQASDHRLWTYLCHHEGAPYVASRWVKRKAEAEQAIESVRLHFFCYGARGLIRDNGLSRLWWLGRIAAVTAPDNPDRFLQVVLHLQDVRSALIERPSVSMNTRVLRRIYHVMDEEYERPKRPLLARDPFREWMKRLNRRGGVLLLDAIPDAELDLLLRAEATAALDAFPHSPSSPDG